MHIGGEQQQSKPLRAVGITDFIGDLAYHLECNPTPTEVERYWQSYLNLAGVEDPLVWMKKFIPIT